MRAHRSRWLALGLLATSLGALACSGGGGGHAGGAGRRRPRRDAAGAGHRSRTVVQKSMPLEIRVIGTAEAYSTVAVRAQITGRADVGQLQGRRRRHEGPGALHARPPAARSGAAAGGGQPRSATSAQAANAQGAGAALRRISPQRGIATREQVDQIARPAPPRSTRRSAPIARPSRTRRCSCSTRRSARRSAGRTGALHGARGQSRARQRHDAARRHQSGHADLRRRSRSPRRSCPSSSATWRRARSRVEAQPPNDAGAAVDGHDHVRRQRGRSRRPARSRSRATFPNDDRRLWPGQFVNVVVTLTTDPNAIVVPTAAVQTGQQGQYVFVVKPDQTVELRPVTVARTAGDETRHQDGLTAGRDRRHRRPAAARAGQPRSASRADRAEGGVMNLSALFIKRPVTTTLIMLGHPRVRRDGVPAAAGQRPADRRLPDDPGAAPACRAPARRRWRRRWRCRSRSSSRRSPASTRSTRRARRAARNITLQFDLSRNIDAAAQDVQAMIAQGGAPAAAADAGAAVVSEGRTRPTSRCCSWCCGPTTLPLSTVDEYAESTIAQRISMVSGVAQVQRVRRAEVRRARRRRSAQAGGARRSASTRSRPRSRTRTSTCRPARCTAPDKTFAVQANGQLLRAAAYGPMIVAYRNGNPVRLDEVAHVYDGVENDKTASWYKGERAIYLADPEAAGHQRRRRSSTPSRRCCRRSASSCRPAVSLDIRTDRSVAIRESVHDVKFTLLLTIVPRRRW